MFWPICTVVVYSIIISVKADAEAERCITLLKPEIMMMECCNGFEMEPEAEECVSKVPEYSSADILSCEVEECLLNKLSILQANGTINETAAHGLLKKIAEEQPTHKLAVERIIQKCLNGQFRKYGPIPVCDANKYYVCGFIQAILECPEWKSSEECKDVKDMTESCKTFFDNFFDKMSIE